VDDPGDGGGKEGTVEWVQLLRGVPYLLEAHFYYVKQGPLGPLLDLREFEPVQMGSTLEYAVKFDVLKQLWDPERLARNSTAPFTDHDVDAFEKTLDILKNTYSMTLQDDKSLDIVSVIYSWPIRVPESYIWMVNRRLPEALILLAHYCLLLSKVDHLWWAQGMSRHLLQTIHKALGKEWESWITWPLQDLVLSEFRNSGGNGIQNIQYGLRIGGH
jgi:hypothetical protein